MLKMSATWINDLYPWIYAYWNARQRGRGGGGDEVVVLLSTCPVCSRSRFSQIMLMYAAMQYAIPDFKGSIR